AYGPSESDMATFGRTPRSGSGPPGSRGTAASAGAGAPVASDQIFWSLAARSGQPRVRSGMPGVALGIGSALYRPRTVRDRATASVMVPPWTATGGPASRSSNAVYLAWVAAGVPAENAQALVGARPHRSRNALSADPLALSVPSRRNVFSTPAEPSVPVA